MPSSSQEGPAVPLDRYAPSGVPVPLPRRDYRYPVAYQHAAVEEALRALQRRRGAMVVASTGLGKTVIATDTARRLRRQGLIQRILVVAPNAVHREWGRHLDAARLPVALYNVQALDAPADHSAAARDLTRRLQRLNGQWLIIIDECHQLRNRQGRSGERRAFKRLLPAVARSGCRVLLLTATPFSTRLENLNHQLLLLPHTAPSRTLVDGALEFPRAWHVQHSQELERLPVCVMLTTPRVAARYGEQDAHGTFVRFGRERRYLPRVALHRVDTPVLLGRDVARALNDGLFDAGGDELPVAGVDRHVRLGLTSSPWALADVLRRTIATPGPHGFARARFRASPEERHRALTPMLEQATAAPPADDPKLGALLRVLDQATADGDKAVVFCERLATVVYLRRSLAALRPELRVGATVEAAGQGWRQKPADRVRRIVDDFAPGANGSRPPRRGGYQVLLSTDAWGLGVNLQDASIVISYDLAWTPVELAQRAGRILRPWPEPRTVAIHCFVPDLGDVVDRRWRRLWAVVRRWHTLLARHDTARQLLDLPAMTRHAHREHALHDLAPGARQQSLGEIDIGALDSAVGLERMDDA